MALLRAALLAAALLAPASVLGRTAPMHSDSSMEGSAVSPPESSPVGSPVGTPVGSPVGSPASLNASSPASLQGTAVTPTAAKGPVSAAAGISVTTVVEGDPQQADDDLEHAVRLQKGSRNEFKVAAAGSSVLGMDMGADPEPQPRAPADPSAGGAFLPPAPLDGQRLHIHWMISGFVSIALLVFGIGLCMGLGQKIDKAEAADEFFGGKGFVPGALVTVKEPFMSNGEPPVQLKAGQTGVIQKIDAVGDALIRFADHGASQWVYEQNYSHLRVR